MFWVISVYFNIRNTLPKPGTFLLGHPVYVCVYMCVCMYICMRVYVLCMYFFIDINSMPHYTVTLHSSHNLRFSFTITFTFNNHKTLVEIHYNVDNHILTSSRIINIIFIHSLRSICLSTYLSFIVKRHWNFLKSTDLTLTRVSFVVDQLPPVFFLFFFIISFLWLRNFLH